jgi:glutaredoxin 3
MAKRLTQARFVEESVAAATVVVFSKSFCPESRRAKASLVALDVDFTSIELDGFCFVCSHEPAKIASTLASMTDLRTLPSCWVGGEFLGAYDDVLAGIEDGVFRALGGRRGPSREEMGRDDDVEEKRHRQSGGGGGDGTQTTRTLRNLSSGFKGSSSAEDSSCDDGLSLLTCHAGDGIPCPCYESPQQRNERKIAFAQKRARVRALKVAERAGSKALVKERVETEAVQLAVVATAAAAAAAAAAAGVLVRYYDAEEDGEEKEGPMPSSSCHVSTARSIPNSAVEEGNTEGGGDAGDKLTADAVADACNTAVAAVDADAAADAAAAAVQSSQHGAALWQKRAIQHTDWSKTART